MIATMEYTVHIPVLLNEVMEYLQLRPGMTVIDATVGTGGHSLNIVERIKPDGRLIGFDRDEESLTVARQRLERYHHMADLVHSNFCDLDEILKGRGIKRFDGILFDLGISSFQLDNPERGFSFQKEGPLDMRLDRQSYISAYDLVNNLNEHEISSLLWNLGQERWHNRIAHQLIEERQKHPIATTSQLANIVSRALPGKLRYRHFRIHPATRTFQAVRIAVNRELETLETTLDKTLGMLHPHGRICVISFHSLEDRIVKLSFRRAQAEGKIRIITPKPLTPTLREIQSNPSSRSAKLRVAERVE